MGWLRLYITTEGQSERKFADDVLRPHLAEFSIDVKTRVVLTNRKLGKRGGILDFENIHGDLQRLMQEDSHPEARFTTMVDLYALPTEFPGWEDARRKMVPTERVAALEAAFGREWATAVSCRISSCTSSRRSSIATCRSSSSGLPIRSGLLPHWPQRCGGWSRKRSMRGRQPPRVSGSSIMCRSTTGSRCGSGHQRRRQLEAAKGTAS